MLRGVWNLPTSGIKPVTLALAGRFFATEPSGESRKFNLLYIVNNTSDVAIVVAITIGYVS